MGLAAVRRNRGLLGYLCIRGGHKRDELIDVAHGEPVGEELHGSLHLLGVEEIPHHPGHPSPCGAGQNIREREGEDSK